MDITIIITPARSGGILGIVAMPVFLAFFMRAIFDPIRNLVLDTIFPNAAYIAIAVALVLALAMFIMTQPQSLRSFIGAVISAASIIVAGFVLVAFTHIDGESFISYLAGHIPALCCTLGIAIISAISGAIFKSAAAVKVGALGVQFFMILIFLKTAFGADSGTVGGAVDTFQKGLIAGIQIVICGVVSYICCLPATAIASLAGERTDYR